MTLNLHAPQLTYIALAAVGLLLNVAGHGHETKGNFWIALAARGTSVAILAWGGFFG